MTSIRDSGLHDLALRLPEFTELASRKAQELIVPRMDAKRGRPTDGEAVSERVIRDYVRRRILSPTYRDPATGRGGIYGYRHLIELLAARVLLVDGWPLDLIAEALKGKSDPEIEAMLPEPAAETDALSLARQFRSIEPKDWESSSCSVVMSVPRDGSFSLSPSRPFGSAVNERLARRATLKAELPRLLEQLGGELRKPAGRPMMSFELADDLVLLIGRDRLSTLTIDEAERIGRAVAAALAANPTAPTPPETMKRPGFSGGS
jgi:hypothetical protein